MICELIRFPTSLQSSQYSTFRQEDKIHFPGTVRQISLLEYVLNSDSPANESLQFNITPPNKRHGLILVRSHNKKGNQKSLYVITIRIRHAFQFKTITGLINFLGFKSDTRISVHFYPFTGRIWFQEVFSLSPSTLLSPT